MRKDEGDKLGLALAGALLLLILLAGLYSGQLWYM